MKSKYFCTICKSNLADGEIMYLKPGKHKRNYLPAVCKYCDENMYLRPKSTKKKYKESNERPCSISTQYPDMIYC